MLGNVEHNLQMYCVTGEYWVKKCIVVFVFTCMFYHADYYRIIVNAYDYECSQNHTSFHMCVWGVSPVSPLPTPPTHTQKRTNEEDLWITSGGKMKNRRTKRGDIKNKKGRDLKKKKKKKKRKS